MADAINTDTAQTTHASGSNSAPIHGALRASPWDPDNEKIASEWRARAECPYPYHRSSNQAGVLNSIKPGEAGGFFVGIDRIGRRAYLKPQNKSAPHWVKAAREKIAADLAYEVGVRVPPVLLATRADAPSGEERNVCLSLVMYSHQWSWCEIKGMTSEDDSRATAKALRESLPEAAARAFAFDTWVEQRDHGGERVNDRFEGHDHNMIFGYNPGTEHKGLIFLDYAISLGADNRWENGGAANCVAATFPDRMLQLMSREALLDAINRIENVPDDVIKDVVGRVPFMYLRPEHAKTITEGLCTRRALVRPALAGHMTTGVKP